ncbi:hypothetical protein AYO45_00100 [Gammaproteobacteria bacterium SCGC AG-212-F23]|nr:hypothetical protein AYO45_00100 [Gammaproteobacteria bacterium SCGC AG-212-F23]
MQLNRYLPCLVTVLGLIAAWHFFAKPTSITMLLMGFAIAGLLGASVYFALLARSQLESIQKMHHKLQNEAYDRLRAEEAQHKLEKDSLQGQKLQAIGTLAGGIAHDFNNILYAIIGYVEMAREDSPPESLIYKNLAKVLEGAKRGQDLVARILTFSRQQHLEFNAICLDETIKSILQLLKPTIPASIELDFEVKNPPYPILGNQTQLHQVIVNIINNAVDAMGGEGQIHISLTRTSAANNVNFDKNYCKIDIIDEGYGMDLPTQERIFEPFFTTKEVGKGTGLGLSTVHAIIKEHQGEISVKSQLGHGTTFTILIPEHKVIEDKELDYGKDITSGR